MLGRMHNCSPPWYPVPGWGHSCLPPNQHPALLHLQAPLVAKTFLQPSLKSLGRYSRSSLLCPTHLPLRLQHYSSPNSAIFRPHRPMLHLHQPSSFILSTHLLPSLAPGSSHMLFPLLKTLSSFPPRPWDNPMFLEVSFTSSGRRSLVLLPKNPPVHSLVMSDSL